MLNDILLCAIETNHRTCDARHQQPNTQEAIRETRKTPLLYWQTMASLIELWHDQGNWQAGKLGVTRGPVRHCTHRENCGLAVKMPAQPAHEDGLETPHNSSRWFRRRLNCFHPINRHQYVKLLHVGNIS
jgi:hypothetical protein